MTATGHAIIGSVIAAKIGNPTLALPIAFFSHLAADATPHWDFDSRKMTKKVFFFAAAMDELISFFVGYLLLTYFFPGTNLAYGFLLIFVAQGFDWLFAPYFFLKWRFPPFSWAWTLNKKANNRAEAPKGVIVQGGILLALLLIAKLF